MDRAQSLLLVGVLVVAAAVALFFVLRKPKHASGGDVVSALGHGAALDMTKVIGGDLIYAPLNAGDAWVYKNFAGAPEGVLAVALRSNPNVVLGYRIPKRYVTTASTLQSIESMLPVPCRPTKTTPFMRFCVDKFCSAAQVGKTSSGRALVMMDPELAAYPPQGKTIYLVIYSKYLRRDLGNEMFCKFTKTSGPMCKSLDVDLWTTRTW